MKKYLKLIPGKGLSKNKPSCENAVSQIACVASVSVRFGSKELQGDKWSHFPPPFSAQAKVFLCSQTSRKRLLRRLFPSGGGGGVLLYMGYIGMCGPKGLWFFSCFGHK